MSQRNIIFTIIIILLIILFIKNIYDSHKGKTADVKLQKMQQLYKEYNLKRSQLEQNILSTKSKDEKIIIESEISRLQEQYHKDIEIILYEDHSAKSGL